MRKKPNFSLKKSISAGLNYYLAKFLQVLELIGWPFLLLIKFILRLLFLGFIFLKKFFFLTGNILKKTIIICQKSIKSLREQIKKSKRKLLAVKKEITRGLKFLKTEVYKFFAFTSWFKLPKLPYLKISFPKIKVPKIKFPGIKVPKLKPPKIKKIPLPSFPKFYFRFPKFLRLKKIYLFFSFLIFICFFALLFLIFNFFRSLPSPLLLQTRSQILTTKIYDRHGALLYKIYKNQNRTLVSLSSLPKYLIDATVAIEDKDFYSHRGFSFRGILRAARENFINHGPLQGGSTITQQLVKNALLSPERTISRKIKEIILALEVESKFTKEEILEMYFNEVGYGGAAYGIAEASEMYFGKKPKDLTLAESALLAGLPAAPTYYSPFGANPKRAIARQHEVLRRMVEDGYITKEQMEKAKKQKLKFAPQKIEIKAPHFVMYVKELLVQKYGEKMVEQGGLSVVTSLDLKIQKMAEEEVKKGVEAQKYLLVGNGAALITKPKTGEILAMVGSKDYFDTKNDGNVNVCLMERQPGSSIKPVNYAVALQKGLTTTTIIPDTPVAYQIPGQPVYAPQNYDGKFRGNVTLRQALANSLNVPAVKILASYGVPEMIALGKKLGITTWEEPSRFGLSLTLGGGEVKMIDMAVVFGTFANSGVRVDLNPILEVKDSKGRTLENSKFQIKNSKLREQVLPEGVAFLISNILSDNYARSAVFGPNSPLVIPNHTVAVKTGTTDTKRDNWTIGYTPSYLVAVWIGNNDNRPMSMYLESGYTGAAPIWHKIMGNLLKGKKNEPFLKPETVLELDVCRYNGLLPCSGCPTVKEYFLYGTEPKVHCKSSDFKITPTPEN